MSDKNELIISLKKKIEVLEKKIKELSLLEKRVEKLEAAVYEVVDLSEHQKEEREKEKKRGIERIK